VSISVDMVEMVITLVIHMMTKAYKLTPRLSHLSLAREQLSQEALSLRGFCSLLLGCPSAVTRSTAGALELPLLMGMLLPKA
jgi:hypothetical protein